MNRVGFRQGGGGGGGGVFAVGLLWVRVGLGSDSRGGWLKIERLGEAKLDIRSTMEVGRGVCEKDCKRNGKRARPG